MDLRLTFNEDEVNYDKWRPNYVPELFKEIMQYSNINDTKHALEIGIGTGQAALPFLQSKCKLTAIELGEKLAEYSRRKFASFSNFEVINSDFESFRADSSTFDLIYSATAFHWIKEEVGYTKVFELLKSGGTLALFWNHPFVCRTDDVLHMEIQKVYSKFRPSNKKPIEFDESECTKIVKTMKNYGFKNCCSKLFYQTRSFTADSYIALLNTYSDHRTLPLNVKIGLEKGIAAAINSLGGILNVYDTMDLYLAEKP